MYCTLHCRVQYCTEVDTTRAVRVPVIPIHLSIYSIRPVSTVQYSTVQYSTLYSTVAVAAQYSIVCVVLTEIIVSTIFNILSNRIKSAKKFSQYNGPIESS